MWQERTVNKSLIWVAVVVLLNFCAEMKTSTGPECCVYVDGLVHSYQIQNFGLLVIYKSLSPRFSYASRKTRHFLLRGETRLVN